MTYRIWQDGYVDIGKGRVLDTVRKAVTAYASEAGCEIADNGGDRLRHDLMFTWTKDDNLFGATLALCVNESDDRRVDFLLGAACTRPWRPRFPAPAHLFGLERELAARDFGGQVLWTSRVASCQFLDPEDLDDFTNIAADYIRNPDRRTAFLVITQDHYPRAIPSAGLLSTIAIDEVQRAALNDRLATRPIRPRQARLFMPACDGLPDVTTDAASLLRDGTISAAVANLLINRQRTPLPATWRDDPHLQTWWADDPFTLPKPAPTVPEITPPVPVDPQLAEARRTISDLRQQLTTVTAELTSAQEANTGLRQQLATYQQHNVIGQLEAQIVTLQADFDQRSGDLEETADERDQLRRANGMLIVQLAHAQRGTDDVDDTGMDTAEFASFSDLLAAAGSTLPGLVVTADPAPAVALDHHPKAPMWRRKSWDALLTLNAYALAKTAGTAPTSAVTDVRAFALSGQPGSLISANIIASTESETVYGNERFHQMRLFPVDAATDPSGHAFFGAHIQLERYKPPAPRLHFFDDVARNGVLYVGYLGEHLPTGRTN